MVNMDAFFCITLSMIVLGAAWKSHRRTISRRSKDKAIAVRYSADVDKELLAADRAAKEAKKQREKDVAELRKQGFTDEIIATILPTINNDN